MVLPRHALYYACLGDAFDGKEAARIGMVNFAVPPGEARGRDYRTRGEKLMKKERRRACAPPSRRSGMYARWMLRRPTITWPRRARRLRLPTRKIPTTPGLRQFLDEKSYKAHLRAVPARNHADRPEGENRRPRK